MAYRELGVLFILVLLAVGCPTGEPDGDDDVQGDDDATDDDDAADDDDATDDDDAADDDDVADDDDSGPGEGWLTTADNHIYLDGEVWRGRGANIHDTRSCWACAWFPPDVGEVERRLDELIDGWGANFVRLDLEAYDEPVSQGGQGLGLLDDPAYMADVQEIVDHIGTKPGAYVLLSLWVDSTFTEYGWPSQDTMEIWETLAATFGDDPHVLYGLVNEPQYNYDGAYDADVWEAMNDTVAAIRAVEDANGFPHHVVAVQGTGGWARFLDYYVDHPITAGNGENIAYEVHVYNPASDFEGMVTDPAQTLPVIIGEYGPADGYMTESDCSQLMGLAESLEVPYLAWTFHMRCPPNLLVDYSGGGCGVGMDLDPTSWGTLLMDQLAQPWGTP